MKESGGYFEKFIFLCNKQDGIFVAFYQYFKCLVNKYFVDILIISFLYLFNFIGERYEIGTKFVEKKIIFNVVYLQI